MSKQGSTLTEVLFTVLILIVGILGLISFIAVGIKASALAKDITVANNHAEYILEEMNTLTTLNDITTTDWADWVTTNNLNTLSNENINIAFLNPTSDPLNIVVTVAWQTGLRAHNINLTTEMTK